ncbi:MAG: hypothetical protein ACI86M_002242 [Saprospiraceae bacterium]|jgi:hypothetical protein
MQLTLLFKSLLDKIWPWGKIVRPIVNRIMKEGEDRSGIKKYPDAENSSTNSKGRSAVVFIHGFSGHMDDTWGDTLKYLREDSQMDQWSLFSLGYNTHMLPNLLKGIWIAAPPIDIIGENLKGEIEGLLKAGYKTVSICAHSMGGLATQSALLKLDSESIQKIQSVILFGTPSNGLQKAHYGKKINDQIRDMDSQSEFIRELRSNWEGRLKENLKSRFLSVAGDHDEFVPRTSSLDPFLEENRKIIGGNHLRIVKPMSADDQTVTTIKTKLLFSSNFNNDWEPAQIAAEYSDYRLALDLYDKTGYDNLDRTNKINYILAKEAIGSSEEALELAMKIAPSNIDALGVIGGRYKRLYMNVKSQLFLDKSQEYYKKGLELAVTSNNDEQIYYQAINCSFLLLMDNDIANAKVYAQQAYDAADRSSIKNVWKYATLGESKLYFDKLDDVIENYKFANERAGNLQQKDSILMNAVEIMRVLGYTEDQRQMILDLFKN